MKKGKEPLTDKLKEKFCKYYAGIHWGDPCGALDTAGYKETENGLTAAEMAEKLFDEEAVRDRIIYLRHRQTDKLVADEAWIRELLADIAANAGKDSDRIRALTSLAKVIGCGTGNRKKKSPDGDEEEIKQPELMLFDGNWEGVGDDSQG